jgi:hypothetical protein
MACHHVVLLLGGRGKARLLCDCKVMCGIRVQPLKQAATPQEVPAFLTDGNRRGELADATQIVILQLGEKINRAFAFFLAARQG